MTARRTRALGITGFAVLLGLLVWALSNVTIVRVTAQARRPAP